MESEGPIQRSRSPPLASILSQINLTFLYLIYLKPILILYARLRLGLRFRFTTHHPEYTLSSPSRAQHPPHVPSPSVLTTLVNMCRRVQNYRTPSLAIYFRRSQWPRGLRRRFTAAPPAAIVSSNPTEGRDVCLVCVLSGRGLCDELITRPEESYRLWRVVVCDQETS
jgi:hypothetical protein